MKILQIWTFAVATIFIAALAISISIQPVILFFAKRQLEDTFINSNVSIATCNVNPFYRLTFYDITIKRTPDYSLIAKELTIHYTLFSLLKRSIPKIYLRDVSVNIHLPRKDLSELSRYLHLKPRRLFAPLNLEFSHLMVDLKSRNLTFNSDISIELDLPRQLLNYIEARIDQLSANDFHLAQASVKIRQQHDGGLQIKQLQYSKLKIGEIHSDVKLKVKELNFDSLTASCLNGKLKGNILFVLDQPPRYSVNLKTEKLDIAALVEDFNLQEKFRMTGFAEGMINLTGIGLKFTTLEGNLLMLKPGGVLVITDTGFLEKVARNNKQPLDALMESLKGYHYNIGTIALSLVKSDLVFNFALDGETGKRNLNITLHNFKL